MKLALVGLDVAALGAVLGSASHVLPAIAALFGVVWYGFVIYDRIKYGPDIEGRLLYQYRRKKPPTETDQP